MWKTLRSALGIVSFAVFSILAMQISCSRSGGALWSGQPQQVAKWMGRTPHRLAVVYWPALRGCTVCDSMLIEKLNQWITTAAEGADVVVATVVPADATAKKIGESALPGHVIEVDIAEYSRAAAMSPRPRIEIWSATGELLLLRSVPNYASQVEMLDEELLAARWFTKPLELPAAGAGPN